MEANKPNCKKCKYYFVTWDKRFPFGCKLFSVKSKQVPFIVVYQSLGKVCESYIEKNNL